VNDFRKFTNSVTHALFQDRNTKRRNKESRTKQEGKRKQENKRNTQYVLSSVVPNAVVMLEVEKSLMRSENKKTVVVIESK
jgi:C4-dicarboxylate transporter